ncbi:MAG TPA: hypothetical protein VKT32_10505, partial [Chthonomonadaceae bacterium]|nr:hypothetical protein [Chthonomonadaceae bacterium]
MLFVLFADWRRLWLAAGAPGRRKQAALAPTRANRIGEATAAQDNLSGSLPAQNDTTPRRSSLPAPPVPSPEARRKRQALLKEADELHEDLYRTIAAHHSAVQIHPASQADLEDFVHGIEQIVEQAEADASWFLRFEEFLGAEVYATWRQIQALVPPVPARRLVRAYVHLARVAQQNGGPLEQQWALYMLAYALDPRLGGAFR